MASAGYSITIKAVDQTTGILDRINAKIAGSQKEINRRLETASAPMKRIQAQLGRTVDLLGGGKFAREVGDVSKQFVGLTRSSYGAFNNISRLLGPLDLIGSATTVAGIAALERRFSSLGQTLTNTGALLNMNPAKIAQWEGAVRLTGGSAGDADSSLRSIQYASTDARFGQNSGASWFLQQAEGPNWRQQSQDINGTALALSRYLATLHGSARSNGIRNMQGAFGFTDGFAAMLLKGPKEIQSLLNQSAALGSPTDSQIGMGNGLAQSLNAAQQSIEGLATAISTKLTPILQPIVDRFTKWTDANRNLISQRLGDVIEVIANKIAAINLKPLEQIAQMINSIVQSIGGWQNVLIGVIGVLTASKVAAIAAPFVQLAAAIAGLTTGAGSFGALGVALRAAGFAVVGGQLVNLAATAAGASQTTANILGDATTGAIAGGAIFGPIGAGVGGALGAAYGGYEAHKASKASQDARADAMVAYYRSQGMSAVQAAALVGGFQQESGLDPAASNDQGGGHYGIAQWDAARQADFKKMFGHDIRQSTLQEQMQFAANELFNGKEGAAGRALLSAKTAPEATDAALSYERPAAPGTPAWLNERRDRLANTTGILARQADGSKYLPAIDAAGNAGAFPQDNEPARLIGTTQPGIGMDREDRMAVDITVHDKRIDVKAHHPRRATTTTVRTMAPLPAGGI